MRPTSPAPDAKVRSLSHLYAEVERVRRVSMQMRRNCVMCQQLLSIRRGVCRVSSVSRQYKMAFSDQLLLGARSFQDRQACNRAACQVPDFGSVVV